MGGLLFNRCVNIVVLNNKEMNQRVIQNSTVQL